MRRSLPSLSLGVLTAGLACATLINAHVNPQTVFQSEWAAAAAAIVAWLGYLLADKDSSELRLGAPIACALLLLLVCALRYEAFLGAGYVLYLGLFVITYALGQRVQRADAVQWLASGMLACALLQSAAAVAQLADWDVGGLVMQKIYNQAFGNIGQANHFNDLVFLGLASTAYLYSRAGLPRWSFFTLTAWLSLTAALSASRGAWLYILAFAVLGGMSLWRNKDEAVRSTSHAVLTVAGIGVVGQLLVSYGGLLKVLGITSSLERAADAGSNGQRMYDWYVAWLHILQKPWWGEGPGTFYKISVDAILGTREVPFSKFAEHAHNLPLNLAAEFGLPIALLVMGTLAWWLLRHLWRPLSATGLWCLACVSVIGLHSMVEYPLWYTYFLIPMALCCGVIDSDDAGLRVLRLPRLAGLTSAALAVVLAGWTLWSWCQAHEAYQAINQAKPTSAEIAAARTELESVRRGSVFAPVAEGLLLQSWQVAEGGAQQIAQRCDHLWPYKPAWFMMMRCAEAYSIAGQEGSLHLLVAAACAGFPKHHDPLYNWAQRFDATQVKVLQITGRLCLNRPAVELAGKP